MDQFELAAIWIINYVIIYTGMLSECKQSDDITNNLNNSISLGKGMLEFTKRQRIVPNIHDDFIKDYWMLPGDKLPVSALLLNHCQLQLWYLKGFYIFLNQCISHKENNILKLLDKSEKDINNQRIVLTCIGALQRGPRN